jgi:hypothetical protein
MSNGDYQGNMTHPFTTNLFLCNLNTTTVAYNPFISDPFVFTAMTLIIFYRPEDPFAEKTITFRLIGAVVYCLRFQNLAA